MNVAELHERLMREHDYPGSLRSLQRYPSKRHPEAPIRARRRIETPPGAQSQADWSDFPAVIVGGDQVYLRCSRLVLSHSRFDAVVWSFGKEMLSWLHCHTEAF